VLLQLTHFICNHPACPHTQVKKTQKHINNFTFPLPFTAQSCNTKFAKCALCKKHVCVCGKY
jgi:hypothetical protein